MLITFYTRTKSVDVGLPFEPGRQPVLRFEPNGVRFTGAASYVFTIYFFFVNWAYLTEQDIYIPGGEDQDQCFGPQGNRICLRFLVEPLKARVSFVGWVCLEIIDTIFRSPAAQEEIWNLDGVDVLTMDHFPLAQLDPFMPDDGFKTSGNGNLTPVSSNTVSELFQPPASKRSENSHQNDLPRDKMSAVVAYTDIEVAQTAIIWLLYELFRAVLWPEVTNDPIELPPGTTWSSFALPDGSVLKLTLLVDKDPWDRPLPWGFVAIGMEALLYKLGTNAEWKQFTSTIAFKDPEYPFLRVKLIRQEQLPGGPAWLSSKDAAKVLFEPIEFRKSIEAIKDDDVQVHSGTYVQNSGTAETA